MNFIKKFFADLYTSWKNDPVHRCPVYLDKKAGGCTHVDGPLCDFPKCSILTDFLNKKSGT